MEEDRHEVRMDGPNKGCADAILNEFNRFSRMSGQK